MSLCAYTMLNHWLWVVQKDCDLSSLVEKLEEDWRHLHPEVVGTCTPGGWVFVGLVHSALGYCHLLLCMSYKPTSHVYHGSHSPRAPVGLWFKRRIRTGMLHQTASLITVGEAITDTRNLSVIIYPEFCTFLSRPFTSPVLWPKPSSLRGLHCPLELRNFLIHCYVLFLIKHP